MALDTFNPYLFVSSGEQSNKFLTPTYADGIAEFQAQRAQDLTGLTVRIDPIQEGTGDPSPSNIRPISGRTGMTVTRAGKNLFDDHSLRQGGGYWFNFNPSQTQRCSAVNLIPVLPNKQYTISRQSGNLRVAIQQYRNASTVQAVNPIITDSGWRLDTYTFTTEAEVHYVWLTFSSINYEYDITDADVQACKFQFEMSSTATAYEPYRGATYPVTWESIAGTVYGGTLDVVSGVLTMDKVLIDLGSITNWRYNEGNSGAFDTNGNLNPIAKNNDCICTNYKTLEAPTVGAITNGDMLVAINKKDDGTAYTGTYAVGTLVVKDSRYSDVESFKAAMNGVMLCYTLATPQTYRLTGAEVRTIAGYNQIYSDAGPIIDIKF